MASSEHIPVLASELIDLLQIESKQTIVDLTLGRSGHAKAVVSMLGPQGHFIGVDADPMQINFAQEVLKGKPKIDLVIDNFANVQKVLKNLNCTEVDAIYADLGLSTIQLLDPERGFSFQSNSALDMRLNIHTQSVSAADVINTWTEEDLANLFWELGEERFSRPIAKAIVQARKAHPITTGLMLGDIVASVKRSSNKRIHPATQVFQALRMYVNDELGTLQTMLSAAQAALKPNGKLAIITFHSIEDRLVKNTFKEWKSLGTVEIITKKAIKPTWPEMKTNPRARSAHLRAIKRIRNSQVGMWNE